MKTSDMNVCGEAESPYCYFHPREFVVGVCAHCLRERLLNLASKQSEISLSREINRRSYIGDLRRKNSISLPKVFALGSFLQRLDSRHRRHGDDESDDEGSIASLEDSFISIKFEDNGNPSWANKKASSIHLPSKDAASTGKAYEIEKSVVLQHTNKRGGVLKWRKQISRLLQLARWKRSSKTAACHAGLGGKVEGVKARRGWIRSFTRRRNNTNTQEVERVW